MVVHSDPLPSSLRRRRKATLPVQEGSVSGRPSGQTPPGVGYDTDCSICKKHIKSTLDEIVSLFHCKYQEGQIQGIWKRDGFTLPESEVLYICEDCSKAGGWKRYFDEIADLKYIGRAGFITVGSS